MAKYLISVALVPGAEFTIEADSVDELLTEWGQVQGNGEWLTEQIMKMVPATQDGEGVGALTATIAEAISQGDHDSPSEVADELDHEAAEASRKPQERVDPWSGKVVPDEPRRRSTARTEPRKGNSRQAPRSQAPADEDANVYTTPPDKFGRTFTIGLPEAPDCDCGEPAARMKAKSQKTGKSYTQYVCAKAAGDDWRDKCDFREFPQ